MQFVYPIVGIIAGYYIGQNGLGVIVGAAVGYLFGELSVLKNKLELAEKKIKALAAKLQSMQASVSNQVQDDVQKISEVKQKDHQHYQDTSVSDQKKTTSRAALTHQQAELRTSENQRADQSTIRKSTQTSLRIKDGKNREGVFSEGLASLASYVVKFFSTGNVLVKVGVIILFFGFSFLVKLAVENSLFPIAYRLIAAAIGGTAMLALGWRLRESRRGYAVAIQGGGIGLLYLTIYAAFRLYHLLPATISFGLLVVIAVTSAVISVKQNSKTLAILSTVGGFLAPVLASTGQGSHVALFSYYIILNLGVLFIAWFKSWRLLNVISFVFTFVISTLWGYKAYQPEYFFTTEPFLLAFFLIFTILAVLYALHKQTNVKSLVDGTIVFGTPLITFALQSKLVERFEYGLAFSALGFAAYYIALAYFLYKRLSKEKYLIAESFLSIGVVFATLTIPFAFEGHITSAMWALEGAAIVWIGARQKQWLARAFGLLLMVLASAIFIFDLDVGLMSQLISTKDFLGSIILFVALLFAGFVLYRYKSSISSYEYPFISNALLVSGMALWVVFGVAQILSMNTEGQVLLYVLIALAATMLGCLIISKKLSWPPLANFIYAYLPLLTLIILGLIADNQYPSVEGGLLGWLVALSVLYWCLYQFDVNARPQIGWAHVGGLLITLIIVTWEIGWRIESIVNWSDTWNWMIWGMLPSAVLWCLCAYGHQFKWPVLNHLFAYFNVGASIIACYILIWAFLMNVSGPGDPYPLRYMPFLNPVDISTLMAIFALVKYYQAIVARLGKENRAKQSNRAITLLLIGLFVWINTFVLRIIHFWKGIPYDIEIMLASQLVQATFSILWASIAVIIMILSSKKLSRSTWLIGAGLMGVVVMKLFLIDLSNSQTMERIVAFIVVGGLLLLVGYLSPVPPKRLAGEAQ